MGENLSNVTSNGPWALVFQLSLVGELHVSHRDNTRTAETLTASRHSLPFIHFFSVPLLLAQLMSTVCVAVLMQCSHVRSIVTSLPGPLWASQFISFSINFPSLLSPPLPFSPIPSPHCPTPPLSLSSPSHPHLPFPSIPSPQSMHVPNPEVPCSIIIWALRGTV